MLRSITKTLACLLMAAPMFADVRPVEAEERPKAGKVLRHVVLFQFKDSATEEQVREIEEAFAELPKKIDAIVDFEWGTEDNVEDLAQGFTHCFVVTFADKDGLKAYLPHEAHQEFVKLLRPNLEKVMVIDYFARK